MVIYKDNDIDRNGFFDLKTLNTVTLVEEEIELRSQSFSEFSIIVDCKKHKDCIYVQVNRKDPEFICFKNMVENSSSFVMSNVLWICNLGSFFFDLSYSLHNHQNLQLQLRHGLTVFDRV